MLTGVIVVRESDHIVSLLLLKLFVILISNQWRQTLACLSMHKFHRFQLLECEYSAFLSSMKVHKHCLCNDLTCDEYYFAILWHLLVWKPDRLIKITPGSLKGLMFASVLGVLLLLHLIFGVFKTTNNLMMNIQFIFCLHVRGQT